jgi:hypothetical protein
MKKLLSAAAFTAMFSGHAVAADMPYMDQPTGLIFAALADVELGVRAVSSTDDPDNNTHFMGSAFGAVSIPLGTNLSIQIDQQIEGYADQSDDEAPVMAGVTGLHLSWRDPSLGLFGVFGGLTMGSTQETSMEDPLGFLVGGEGQMYFNDFTLYAQAGYGHHYVDTDPEGFRNGWFVRGIGRYFISDDVMIEADFAYGHTDTFIDGNDAGDIYNWGVKGKWRPMEDMPFYTTLAYRGGYYDATTEDDHGKDHAFLVGFSIMVGPQTLKENDRAGATLSTPMLVGRAAAWTEPLD